MRFQILLAASVVICASILWVLKAKDQDNVQREAGTRRLDGAAAFAKFHKDIRTAEGASGPAYLPGYRYRELKKARSASMSAPRVQSANIVWTERGPGNVPGRTRGLIVDPDDPAKNTWYAGSAGGGVWKTTNAGQSWTLLTPDLSNLATTVLAMAPSNHNFIYAGTGEDFDNLDGISGNGIFKSTDRGLTWAHLAITSVFEDVSRLAIDPANASIVVAATATGIYRTIDGGNDWVQTSSLTNIQDLKATPGNFNVQYASKPGLGVLKSTDGGVNWNESGDGIGVGGRTEIAISPVNVNRVFASAEGVLSGGSGDLFVTDNAGSTWSLVDVSFSGNPADFLGGQGWYDNTIVCDPFNASAVYVGGVSLFRVLLGTGTSEVANYKIEEDNTESFLLLNSFAAIQYDGQRLTAGPAAGEKSVEVRFGPGISQFAHRFTVPAGATSGVPVLSYSYANYVQVPFQVWDVTNPIVPRQLMVSFRDQANNGQFDLVPQYFGTDPALNSREYLFINDVTYSTSPHANITVPGGHEHQLVYSFFPALAESATWDPDNLPVSHLLIHYIGVPKLNATTTTVADVYSQFDGKNRFQTFGIDVHPDQHNMIMIPTSANTSRILLANDGGIFLSSSSATPGVLQGEWTMSGNDYRTSQFYGADKRPGFDQYLGGTQDNGTWKSPTTLPASASSHYTFCIGGDGFEVIWHNLNDQKLIGGSQFNGFRRSTDGGLSWVPATSGLSGSHPFISKLANSRKNPERIYTLSSAGVFYSANFGASWTLTPITSKWSTSSLMDVEVSRANPNIVWAGSGMSGTALALHVSTDAGVTFAPTLNPSPALISGGITKLASHPFEPNTAYALFSQAGNPKILRTTDLGQTWEDISGFDTGDVSTRGFPDVAVYCLYVRQDNPDILWAGTEIGIVESLDNGVSWGLITDIPAISVWDMKGQDNQVVIATHGRGIWTATLDVSQESPRPEILEWGTSPEKEFLVRVHIEEAYDQLEFYDGSNLVATFTNQPAGDHVYPLESVAVGQKQVKVIGYQAGAPEHSKTYAVNKLNILDVESTYLTYFGTVNDLYLQNMTLGTFEPSPVGERRLLHSTHPYQVNQQYAATILHPVIVSATNAFVRYEDVALVEPGIDGEPFGSEGFLDYVVMEASMDGLEWTPLADGYDARRDPEWLMAYDNGVQGAFAMRRLQEVDLLNTFLPGDTLLFRYRLHSNATVTGWGVAVNYIAIQEVPTHVEQQALEGLMVYPVPAVHDITVEFPLENGLSADLAVIDLQGRTFYGSRLYGNASGKVKYVISAQGMTAGAYVVTVKTGKGSRSRKIIFKR